MSKNWFQVPKPVFEPGHLRKQDDLSTWDEKLPEGAG